MSTLRILVNVVLLLLPVVIDSSTINSTCEIPSVEAGENTTLTIHFGTDLSNEKLKDFTLMHLYSSKVTNWRCRFSRGDVHNCDNTTYYSWDRKVTDVFRVYIHNVSQFHEGMYYGAVLPVDSDSHKTCRFIIKAVNCSTDSVNRSNGHLSCNNHTVSVGQTCTVTCNPGHYFQENQTSMNYTCVGKNKWSPNVVTICEVKSDEATNVTEWKNTEKSECLNCSPFITLMIIFIIGFVITGFVIIRVVIKCRKERKMRSITEVPEELIPWKAEINAEEIYMLQCIRAWYPKLFKQTYFFPSLQTNISQQVTHMTDTDVHNDSSLQRVLHGIRKLQGNGQKKEAMFVVSQLQFGKYLGKPSFAPAVTKFQSLNNLLDSYNLQFHEGDFDALIIHRQHGLFILQISSMGRNFSPQNMTHEEKMDLVNKVKDMTEKLRKAEIVLRALFSILKVDINITKCLAMPNIKSSQLRTITRNPAEWQDTHNYLGARWSADLMKLCLLSDQLTDDKISSCLNHCFRQNLRVWWQRLIKASGPQLLLSKSSYEDLVARFCGPATTVEVYSITSPRLNITPGEGVMARIVLFPQQVDVLNRPQPGVFLSGPPGTGKTIVLIMQGLTWIQRGYDIHVVSTCDESRAVTFVIEHQLQETARRSTVLSSVRRHQFDLKNVGEVENAVRCLKSLSGGGQLCVIADEVANECREYFKQFVDRLIKNVPRVNIWGASTYHDIVPQCLKEVTLTTPLRSPPVVVKEVKKSVDIKRKLVHEYTVSDVPVPTHGPPVGRIEHNNGQSRHTGNCPHDCVECGRQISRVLTNLNVNRNGENNDPSSLQYKDVLVLCSNPQMTTTTCSLAQGLQESVPVLVVNKDEEDTIRRMALGVDNKVAVAHWDDVHGLERKVVIVESEICNGMASERLYAMSRSMSQLVLIVYRREL